MAIRIDGADYDTIELLQLSDAEHEPACQRLKAMGKELAFPRIERIRQLLREGWGLVMENRPRGTPAVITDRHRELVLIYRPVDAQDAERAPTSLPMAEVRTLALRFARELYERSGGNFHLPFRSEEIAGQIGITDPRHIDQIASYLYGKRLLSHRNAAGFVILSELGVAEVETALAEPTRPTASFPAVNVLTAHTINLGPGAQLVQGGDNLQQASYAGADIAELKTALARIEALAIDLGDTNRGQIEGLVALLHVEADRRPPSHGTIKALLTSMKTMAEAFVAATAANLATAPANAAAPAIVDLAHRLLLHWPG